MALLGSMNFAALTLCVLVLAAHNYQAQASSRVIFGKKNFKSFVNYNSSVNGLCATSVIIRGYKCQEFEVRTLIIYATNYHALFIMVLNHILYDKDMN